MGKTIYFSGSGTWLQTESFVNELREFLCIYKFYDYAKKYLYKSDYQKLKNFDYVDSPSLCWGELWEPPFWELIEDNGIFVEDEKGCKCENPNQLMEYMIDHFLTEVNEHLDFVKGKTLITSQSEDNAGYIIFFYLKDKGLEKALSKVFSKEDDIDMFFGNWDGEVCDIPGGHTIESLGHSAMYSSYYYDIYFEDSKTKEAIKFIVEEAKEKIKEK